MKVNRRNVIGLLARWRLRLPAMLALQKARPSRRAASAEARIDGQAREQSLRSDAQRIARVKLPHGHRARVPLQA